MSARLASWALLGLLAALPVGCANSTAFVATASSLQAIDDQVLVARDRYAAGFKEGKVTEAQRVAFNAFLDKYNQLWPHAVGIYMTARRTNDAALTGQAVAIIGALVAEAGPLCELVGIFINWNGGA